MKEHAREEMVLPDELAPEIEGIATLLGRSRVEMIRDLLLMGVDSMTAGSTQDRLEALETMLADATARLDLIGAAVVGTQRLLAMWATKSDLKIPEEDLQAELESVGAMDWELLLARRQIVPSGSLESSPATEGGNVGDEVE